MDLLGLVKQLEKDFNVVANNPMLQFESDGQQLVFSSLLPERTVLQNSYRENNIQFRTMIANASTRYSPPIKKGKALTGSVAVELGESDIASELAMHAYEALNMALQQNATQEGIATLIRWFDTTVSQPLALLREKERADAITKGYYERTGANGLYEMVRYPSFPGHRVVLPSGTTATPAGLYDPAFDLLGLLKQKKRLMEDKGFRIGRILINPTVQDLILGLDQVKAYGMTRFDTGSTVVNLPLATESETIRAAFASIGLPIPEVVDSGYTDEDGYHKFMGDQIILVSNTNRQQVVEGLDKPLVLYNTLGYTAIGTATGQLTPGIATYVEAHAGKQARIEATGWQTTFAVLESPDAVVSIDIPALA